MGKDSLRSRLEGCVSLPALVAVIVYSHLFDRLHPQSISLPEKGMGLTIDLPHWILLKNDMATAVHLRVREGKGRGKIPTPLRGQGLLLRPGQKRKLYIPLDSFYDIEVFTPDGEKVEQIRLRVSVSIYAV